MKNLLCDGIFDLFHHGHLQHLKQIKEHFSEPTTLIVALFEDDVTYSYKRVPVISLDRRTEILKSCYYCDEVIILPSLEIDSTILNKYKIDYVFHAFQNNCDFDKQQQFYLEPIKRGIFITLPYTEDTSTTQIIKDNHLSWDEIWMLKGQNKTDDLYSLNGWESTEFDPVVFINNFKTRTNIHDDDYLVEIGCGAGLLYHYLYQNNTDIMSRRYIGVDKSTSLVMKHLQRFHNICLNFDASVKLFKTNYFDFCLSNSMLDYLDNFEQLDTVIDNMERIASKGVYLGCIRYQTHKYKKGKHQYNGVFTHLVIPKQYFIDRGYHIVEAQYEQDQRYDAYKIFK